MSNILEDKSSFLSTMVQQLSLFSSIPSTQYKLLSATLATLTGSSSKQLQCLNLIASPKTIVKYEPNSKNTQFEQYKLTVKSPFSQGVEYKEYKTWVIQESDIPAAGKRKINTQAIIESTVELQQSQTIDIILDGIGYKIENEYLVKGEKFFYGNITIELFKLLVNSEGSWTDLNNGHYVIKAYINVEKATDVELLTKASQELLSLKAELQGLVELEIPDRNSMDSRISSRK